MSRPLLKIAFVALAIVTGPALATAPRAAQAGKKTDADCRQFVQQFYNWYANAQYESWGVSQSLDDALDQNLFSVDLTAQLDDVIDSENDHDDVWLDFDPVLNTKHPWDNYAAGAVTRKGDHFLVEVYGVRNRRRNGRPDVVAELVFQIGRWTFVNFHYPDHPASSGGENLLNVLKGIRKAHPVKHHAQPSDEPQA
jgi:hypothetical protein